LPPLSPRRGELARQLEVLRLVTQGVGPQTPVLATIFSPLAQAKNLVGGEQLLVHLREYPDAVHAGLTTIAESVLGFVKAAKAAGISGIFYAIQQATYRQLSPDEYVAFGRPYDLDILDAAGDLWLNVVHLHGDEVMFDAVADYPAQVINWHDRETPPTLAQGQKRWAGAVCGGLRQWDTLVRGTPYDVRREARIALKATGGTRVIISTGCVAPIITPVANLHAARLAVEETG
jgi:uroporphyrinogen decarboxylase